MAKLLYLKVTLQDVDMPKVWRKLIFPADVSFHDLNRAIQYSMEWDDIDNYSFEVQKDGKKAHVIPLSDDPDYDYTDFYEGEIIDAEKTVVGDFLKEKGDKIRYIFDDDVWFHTIEVTSAMEADSPTIACIDGRGACPPSIVVSSPADYWLIKRSFGLPVSSSSIFALAYFGDEKEFRISMETLRNYLELRPNEVFDPTRLSMREIEKRFEIWLTTAKPRLVHTNEPIQFDMHACQWWGGYWTNHIEEEE